MNVILGLIAMLVTCEAIATAIKDRIEVNDYNRVFILAVVMAYMAEKYIRFMIEGVYP